MSDAEHFEDLLANLRIGPDGEWVADESSVSWPCADCARECTPPDESEVWEWYMVHDQVWSDAGMGPHGVLCVGCLEGRLGRRLDRGDFPDLPVNVPSPTKSERLNDRLGPASLWDVERIYFEALMPKTAREG